LPCDEFEQAPQLVTPPRVGVPTRWIVIGISLVALLLIGGTFLLGQLLASSFECPNNLSIHDRPRITKAESRQLMSAMRSIYRRVLNGTEPLSPIKQLNPPEPIAVLSITNNVATVRVGSEYQPGGGQYASAWSEIFQKFHPTIESKCVRIDFVWANGASSAQCCAVPL